MQKALEIFGKCGLKGYAEKYHLCAHERATVEEILLAVRVNDLEKLEWFGQFGSELRHVLLNSYAYRKGLEFGFTEVGFDEYGWLNRPVFLDQQETEFGRTDKSRYGNHSTVTVGMGPNGLWCYGLSISWGTAGSSSGLSVYNQAFASKCLAFDAALSVLKLRMEEKVGNRDTGNYNQKIIGATLKDIERFRVSQVQLSLF